MREKKHGINQGFTGNIRRICRAEKEIFPGNKKSKGKRCPHRRCFLYLLPTGNSCRHGRRCSRIMLNF